MICKWKVQTKVGGDEGFVLQKRKKEISDCLDIVLEKEKYEIAPLTAFCQAGFAAVFGVSGEPKFI